MKHKGLYFMVALALAGVGAAHAQDNTASTGSSDSAAAPAWPNGFDDRWYIAPTIGGYYNDTDRNTNSRQFYYGVGVGRFIAATNPPTSKIHLCNRNARRGAARLDWVGFNACIRNSKLSPTRRRR